MIQSMWNKTSNIIWMVPYLIAGGAVVLFVVAYISHAFFGEENIIEETAEDLLRKKYSIDVEFSRVKENNFDETKVYHRPPYY